MASRDKFLITGMSAGFSPLGYYFTAPRTPPPPPPYNTLFPGFVKHFLNCTHTLDRMIVTECLYASLRAARLVEALAANGVFG